MYNRYTPQPDGTYQRQKIEDPGNKNRRPPSSSSAVHNQNNSPQKNEKQNGVSPFHFPATDFLRQLLPKNLDTGDLIIILLLLLMAGDSEENRTNALLTLGLYLLM